MGKRVRLDHYTQNDRNNEAIGLLVLAAIFGTFGGLVGLSAFGLTGAFIGFFIGCGVASKLLE